MSGEGLLSSYSYQRNFCSDRPDGRFERSFGFIHHYLSRRQQKLSLDRVAGISDFASWQEQVREKVRQMLCMMPEPRPEFLLLSEERREGYRLQRWELYPEEGLVVPFLMLIPEKVISSGQPAPAVVCTPGSYASKESLAGEPDAYMNRFPLRNRQAWWYAKAGMIAIATDNPAYASSGEAGLPDPGKAFVRFQSLLYLAGRTYAGFVTEQRLMLFDFLKKHPLVDASRLAVSGLSLGCTATLYPMLLCPDIAAMVYNDFVCDQTIRLLAVTEYETDEFPRVAFFPGENDWFSIQPDLLAALAPRRILLAEGGPWVGHIEKVARAYEMLGARDNMTLCYYTKYAEPGARRHEGDDLRQARGLTHEEYYEWANVDPSQHSFHPDLALPWLKGVFFGDGAELFDEPGMMLELQHAKEETERHYTLAGRLIDDQRKIERTDVDGGNDEI